MPTNTSERQALCVFAFKTPGLTSMREVQMNLDAKVGETAGQIWRCLESDCLSIQQISLHVPATPELIAFALGWLAREGRIDLSDENSKVMVRRRESCSPQGTAIKDEN